MAKPVSQSYNKNANSNKKPSGGSQSTYKAPSGANTTPAKPAAQQQNFNNKPTTKVELKPGMGEPTPQAVAEAAYFLWLQRGGNETVNWLEAEAMLKRKAAAR